MIKKRAFFPYSPSKKPPNKNDKIAINTTYGGFSLSNEALALYAEYSQTQPEDYLSISRCDPILIRVVEELGERACKSVKIVEVPDEVEWDVHDYDGIEWVAEKHRTWS